MVEESEEGTIMIIMKDLNKRIKLLIIPLCMHIGSSGCMVSYTMYTTIMQNRRINVIGRHFLAQSLRKNDFKKGNNKTQKQEILLSLEEDGNSY